MKYKNAAEVLPPDLLNEVQKHCGGELLYIPKKESRASWGTISGARAMMTSRNFFIIKKHKEGCSVENLIEEFCLSESSIKKIIYSKQAFSDVI